MTYRVTDANGAPAAAPLSFTIMVADAPSFSGQTVENQAYTLNQAILPSLTLPEASGGTGDLTYALRIQEQSPPALPDGLAFDNSGPVPCVSVRQQ